MGARDSVAVALGVWVSLRAGEGVVIGVGERTWVGARDGDAVGVRTVITTGVGEETSVGVGGFTAAGAVFATSVAMIGAISDRSSDAAGPILSLSIQRMKASKMKTVMSQNGLHPQPEGLVACSGEPANCAAHSCPNGRADGSCRF